MMTHRDKCLGRALDYLVQTRVVRRRIDPETLQEVFNLDHDSLCVGVQEAQRRAGRWQSEAETGWQRFQRSDRWQQKWWELLRPHRQVVLLYQWMRGHFRYGDLRIYTLLSLLRLVPWGLSALLAIAAIIFFLNWQQDQRSIRRAQELFAFFGSDTQPLSEREVQIVVDLSSSTSTDSGNFYLVREALQPANIERLGGRLDIILHAAVSFRPRIRRRVIEEVLLPQLSTGVINPRIIYRYLRVADNLFLADPEFSEDGSKALLSAIEQTTDQDMLDDLVEGFRELATAVPADQSRQLASRILRSMAENSKPIQLAALGRCFEVIANSSPSVSSQDAISSLVNAISQAKDVNLLRPVAEALVAVVQSSPENAEFAVDHILRALPMESDPNTLHFLVASLETITDGIPPDKGQVIAIAIIRALQHADQTEQLLRLVADFEGVGSRASFDDVKSVATVLVEAMSRSQPAPNGMSGRGSAIRQRMELRYESRFSRNLATAVQKLTGMIDTEDVPQIVNLLVEAADNAADPRVILEMLEGMITLGENVEPEKVRGLMVRLIRSMEKVTDPFALWELAHRFNVVAGKVPPDDAPSVAKLLVGCMQNASDAQSISSVGLKEVLGRLRSDDTPEAALMLVNAIQNSSKRSALYEFNECFADLIPRLPPGKDRDLASALIKAIQESTDSDKLSFLAECFGLLAHSVAPQDSHEVASVIMKSMQRTYFIDARAQLAKSLFKIRVGSQDEMVRLVNRSALETVFLLIQAMRKDPGHGISEFVGLFEELIVDVPSDDDFDVVDQLIHAQHDSVNPDVFAQYAMTQCLDAVMGRMHSEEMSKLADLLAQNMSKTSDPFKLLDLTKGLNAVIERMPESKLNDAQRLAFTGAAKLAEAMPKANNMFEAAALSEALCLISESVPPDKREDVDKSKQKAMLMMVRELHRPQPGNVLASIGPAVEVLATNVPSESVHEVCTVLVRVIWTSKKIVPNRYDEDDIAGISSQDITELANKVALARVADAAKQLSAIMQRCHEVNSLTVMSDGLAVLAQKLGPQQGSQSMLIGVLKNPFCVRMAQGDAVHILNMVIAPNEEFDRSVWKLIAWAERNGVAL